MLVNRKSITSRHMWVIRAGQFLSILALLLASFSSFGQSNTLTPAVASDLLEAYEDLEAENYELALEKLNDLMARRGDKMRDFDKASVLQIRGSALVSLERYEAAIRDFSEVLRLNALPEEQNTRMRFNMAQLYFVTEQFQATVGFFEEWLGVEENLS